MAVALLMKTRRQQPELVKPAKPTPNESKGLSDIDDQGGLRYQSPAIMAYKHTPSVEGKDPAKMIKSALSEALVYYYPLAGRLREGQNQKLIVDCTGDGALFVEAESDVTLEQIGDAILPPCPLMDELLLDAFGSQGIIASPLLVFQVTRLKCGGFILGVRYNHTMCDVFGFAQLMNNIVEIVRGVEKPSTPPVWERHLLTARNPARITCVHHEYDCKEHAPCICDLLNK
ncbi:hypothetical protein Nepgr_024461 [Nepenthes gracilis]|uniref:Uncharacterized protein n=1 Tax=Nepenthes gracilis TaxID=150966 RepID=A0AAD3XYT9_NEPGR|nr:hypothetical protein Nepgr_024461 [Nepenthes gracilis]